MGQITNGLAKIEIGPVGPNGSMGSVLQVLGKTNIDSLTLAQDDGTTTDFNVEEQDDPIFTRKVPGKVTVAFQVSDPVIETFLAVFGGTITGSGPARQWNAPAAAPIKEVSIKITPEIGYMTSLPRAVLTAKLNFNVGKNNLMMIDVSADVLTPQDGVTPKVIVGGVVSDAGGSPGQAQTITFAALGTKSIATNSPLTLTATSSSGLPITYMSSDPTKVTINGNVATLLATGTVNIIATQMGNAMYAAATPIVNQITITA